VRRIDGRSSWRPFPTPITLGDISSTEGDEEDARALVETSDGVRVAVPESAPPVGRETLPAVSTYAFAPAPPAAARAQPAAGEATSATGAGPSPGRDLPADLTVPAIRAIPADQTLPTEAAIRTEPAGPPAEPTVHAEPTLPENWLDLAALTEIEGRVARLAGPLGQGGGGSADLGAAAVAFASVATVLWFDALRSADRVAVTPLAAPIHRAIGHLLDGAGSAAGPDYPSGPGTPGPAATVWSALARRRLGEMGRPVPSGRLVALLDAPELAGPQIWEAVTDPRTAGLGEVIWVVVVRHPAEADGSDSGGAETGGAETGGAETGGAETGGVGRGGDDTGRAATARATTAVLAAGRYERLFAAAGWQVVQVRHGRRREAAFAGPGGQALRARLEALDGAESLAPPRGPAEQVRRWLPGGGATGIGVSRALDGLTDEEVRAVLDDLGGHDLPTLVDAYDEAESSRPTVVFVHTLDGWTPRATRPDEPDADPWSPPAEGGRAAALVARVAARLARPAPEPSEPPQVPDPHAGPVDRPVSPADAVERFLAAARSAARAPAGLVVLSEGLDGSATAVAAQLGALGVTWRDGGALLPVGFVDGQDAARAAATWAAGVATGAQSVLAVTGTPVSPTGSGDGAPAAVPGYAVVAHAAPESVPGAVCWRPAFAVDAGWCMAEALRGLGHPAGRSSFLWLPAEPVDDAAAHLPADDAGRERRRRQVLAGAYRTRDGGTRAAVTLAGCGAAMPAVLAAADELAAGLGRAVSVICVTSPDLLLAALSARRGLADGDSWVLDEVFPPSRRGPLVTVSDGDAATLALLAGIHGDPVTCLGAPTEAAASVTMIVGAALDLLDELDG
jgi:pyruvate dehydrogenase E1 component